MTRLFNWRRAAMLLTGIVAVVGASSPAFADYYRDHHWHYHPGWGGRPYVYAPPPPVVYAPPPPPSVGINLILPLHIR